MVLTHLLPCPSSLPSTEKTTEFGMLLRWICRSVKALHLLKLVPSHSIKRSLFQTLTFWILASNTWILVHLTLKYIFLNITLFCNWPHYILCYIRKSELISKLDIIYINVLVTDWKWISRNIFLSLRHILGRLKKLLGCPLGRGCRASTGGRSGYLLYTLENLQCF